MAAMMIMRRQHALPNGNTNAKKRCRWRSKDGNRAVPCTALARTVAPK